MKVAVAQAGSVLFDGPASVEKAASLIRQAGVEGAHLVLLPEAFIPGYPRGLGFGTVTGHRSRAGRELWQIYSANALEVPGPGTRELGAAARDAGIHAGVGVIERDGAFGRSTLYCTLLLFGPEGELLSRHRKLKPTGSERLFWGEGDGSTLKVIPTRIGRIGGLICWENYMPMARMALYGQGVEIYLAPTADARDTWTSTLRHIACEGRCFVLGANQFVTRSMYPDDLPGVADLADQPAIMCRGGSAIIGPLGDILAGPLLDQEGLICAEIDLNETVRARFDFDVAGHYSRPDIFHLSVDTRPRSPLTFGDPAHDG